MPPSPSRPSTANRFAALERRPRLGRAIVLGALALAFAATARAVPTTSVVVGNLVDGEPGAAAEALVDLGAIPLGAGTSAEGDGAIVALGCFTAATAGNPFAGWWVPLTGPTAANTGVRSTTVGDGGWQAAGAFGFLEVQIDFDAEVLATSLATPPADAQLAVAVFNGATVTGATRFNIATNPAWRWRAPSVFPELIHIDLNAAGTVWFGGAASARQTSVAVAGFPGQRDPARLTNISTRGFVGTGDAVMIPGFVIGGAGSKRVLVRAVGPGLARFGVGARLENPRLALKRQTDQSDIAANDDWGDQADPAAVRTAMGDVWAFPIDDGSADAAVVLDLPADEHGYSTVMSGVANTSGIAIAEVYVVNDESSPAARVQNLSTRGYVGTGDEIMIAGFYLGAGANRRLLVRAVGPGLADHGVGGVLADPILTIRPAGEERAIVNDDWEDGGQGAAIAEAANKVFAFPLIARSTDAALIVNLPGDDPAVEGDGGYTVQVSGADGGTGVALVEIYELPW